MTARDLSALLVLLAGSGCTEDPAGPPHAGHPAYGDAPSEPVDTASPTTTTPTGAGTASLRVVHLLRDLGALDVYLGGELLIDGAETGFTHGSASDDGVGYLEVAAGPRPLRVVAAGGDATRAAVVEEDVELREGEVHTLLLIGHEMMGLVHEPSAPRAWLVDDVPTIVPGQAAFQALHAAPGYPDVDAYAGPFPLIDGLKYGERSELLAAPAGPGALDLDLTGDGEANATFHFDLVADTWAYLYVIPHPHDSPPAPALLAHLPGLAPIMVLPQ